MTKPLFFQLVFFLVFVLCSCDDNVLPPKNESEIKRPQEIDLNRSVLSGTGVTEFSQYAPMAAKPVKLFYHIPAKATNLSPVLFAFHGAARDGIASRDLLIEESNALTFILIVPEYSEEFYPGSDAYNLGNIFTDGDKPSPNTLNNEEEWTFSIIEPIFDWVKAQIKSDVIAYDVFGHSAGAQFAHRFMIYKPKSRVNKFVIASSGWYTMLNNSIEFPYGTKNSPAQNEDVADLLAREVHIIVGDQDNDENSFGLRHNKNVDVQGLNRFQRAQYFFSKSKTLASDKSTTFNWSFKSLPGVGHDFDANSLEAANWLYK